MPEPLTRGIGDPPRFGEPASWFFPLSRRLWPWINQLRSMLSELVSAPTEIRQLFRQSFAVSVAAPSGSYIEFTTALGAALRIAIDPSQFPETNLARVRKYFLVVTSSCATAGTDTVALVRSDTGATTYAEIVHGTAGAEETNEVELDPAAATAGQYQLVTKGTTGLVVITAEIVYRFVAP